jgi:hypothetical protein
MGVAACFYDAGVAKGLAERSTVLRLGMMGVFCVARRTDWECRTCAMLRYSSEGGYLRPSGLGRLGQLSVMLRAFGNLPRPESWLPYVLTSPQEAAEAGLGHFNVKES